MLVLTRFRNEVVVIGDPENPLGRVKVSQIKGDRVRLAFDFPSTILVHREEVAKVIREKKPQPRPAVEIARDSREPNIPRHKTLEERHIPILLWLANTAHAVRGDALAEMMRSKGWSERGRDELIEWELLSRLDDGSIRVGQPYGVKAAKAYAKHGR